MSDTDSFIDEVSEEVRRDKLYATFRRYGWIAALVIVILVGGAAWNEWRKASIERQAQGTGDAVLAAMEEDDSAARLAALSKIEADGQAADLVSLIAAAEGLQADNPQAASERLKAVAANGDLPRAYRDLATLKLVLMDEGGIAPDEKRDALNGLATAGAPYRLIAEEQLAILDLAQGDTDGALERLRAILDDQELTAGLRQRVSQLIVVSGGSLDDG